MYLCCALYLLCLAASSHQRAGLRLLVQEPAALLLRKGSGRQAVALACPPSTLTAFQYPKIWHAHIMILTSSKNSTFPLKIPTRKKECDWEMTLPAAMVPVEVATKLCIHQS